MRIHLAGSLLLAALLSSASAFAPAQLGRTRLALRESDSADVALDPFDAFESGSSDIAVRDVSMGSGEGIVDGDVVTIQYVGRLFPSQQQFGKTEGLPVKVGKGDLVKGFEKALLGRKVGSEFIVRIPASLGWGDRGKLSPASGRQVIPPGADLEFEVSVQNISQGFMGEVELFGTDRVATLAFCIFLIAFAPQIEIFANGLLGK